MDDRQRLARLLHARHPLISIVSLEEAYAVSLIGDISVDEGRQMMSWSFSRGLFDGPLDHPYAVPDTEHPAGALYYQLRHDAARICVMLDLAPHLSDAKTVRLLRDVVERYRDIRGNMILIDHDDALPLVVRQRATRFELSLPDENELIHIVSETIQREHRQQALNAKVSREQLSAMVQNLRGLSRRQAEQVVLDSITDDRRLDLTDLGSLLARKREMLHHEGLLQFVESPVDLSQIAGFANLKLWLTQREASFTSEALLAGLQPPRGILMLGVPGAGKSMCAKAVATAWKRPLLRLDPGILYDRYIGESERRLREALRQAEAMAPIVLWIDEIEKGFASAAAQNIDGGLSQRMFGTLLTWMQEHSAAVFLFATANNIYALPPELLRKGRFDEIFFVDLPEKEVRKNIFAIHLDKRAQSPESFDLDRLAEHASGFTGAEIEQAVISALHGAFAEKVDLTTERIIESLRNSPPLSITMSERVQSLRDWSKGRCVPAD